MTATPSNAVAGLCIRPYCPSDRGAVRDICAATCWMGEPRLEACGDEWVWAEVWTRYFTDREGEHCQVAVRGDGAVVGYLLGTRGARRADRYARRLMPGVAWRVLSRGLLLRRRPRRAMVSLARAMLRGDLATPEEIARDFPATMHCDLLPEARGAGLGARMLAKFLGDMRRLGCPGVHARTLSLNAPAVRSLQRAGFHLADHRPTRAFMHVELGAMDIETWVMAL